MNNNLTPETEFEKLLLSDKRIISMIKNLRDMANGNFGRQIDRGFDDYFVKMVADKIARELFIAEKIGPLELKLKKINWFVRCNEFKLYEIDKNGEYEAFESELLNLLYEKLDDKGNLASDSLYINDQIDKLTEKFILESKLNEVPFLSTKSKNIKI